ncbi:38813_t:CDS:2, partial [Gigaspora margarita]
MSTNPTPQNVSCLKNLALNILKNGTPEVIAKGVEVPELDPCLEDYVKDLSQCPKCAMEVEPIDYSKSSLQENQTLNNTKQVQKRPSKNTTKDKSSNKKPKQTKKESHVLNELIKELSTEPETPQTPVVRKENADNFVDLYNNIATAEAQNEITNQEVITCYYLFGKALEDRYDNYKKNNPKRTAQVLVNKEVRLQLPNSVSDDLLRKKKESPKNL